MFSIFVLAEGNICSCDGVKIMICGAIFSILVLMNAKIVKSKKKAEKSRFGEGVKTRFRWSPFPKPGLACREYVRQGICHLLNVI